MNTVYGTGPLAFPSPNQGMHQACETAVQPPLQPAVCTPENTQFSALANPLALGEQATTGTYNTSANAPASLNFQAGGPAQLLQQGIQNFDSLNPQQKSQLNQLAGQLGFVNGRNLANSLRHLPADKAANWLKSLPASAAAGPEAFSTARSALTQTAKGLIEDFFASRSLPQPAFKGEQALWDGPSYLAVFNSMTEMGQRLPGPLLQRLSVSETGLPLSFERKDQPEPRGENLMQVLSGCMCIAHTDIPNQTITLYNPAMSMDPAEIMNRPAVQDFIKQVGRRPPDAKAVESLQSMLKLALPERDLGPKGQLNDKTWGAVYEFQTLQMLKQAEDLVGDDKRLRSDEKKALQTEIKDLIADLRSDGTNNSQDLRALLTKLQSQGLSPAGAERVQQLQRSIPADPVTGGYQRLQPAQLEPLIRNWFGMIDSGQQLDFSEQVINHEFGHLLQSQNQLLDNWKQISFAENSTAGLTDRSEIMSGTLQEQVSGWGVKLAENFGLNFSNSYGSDYARVNPEEDFAESFRMFTRDPERLAADNPLKFAFMAGATGTYTGREQELVNLLKAQGHSDLQLQNMVRILRNQNSAFVGQTTKEYADKGMGLVNKLAKVITPTLAIAEYFGKNPVANAGKSISDSVTEKAVKIADQHTPRFDLNVTTMLPGLEKALGMNTQIQAVLPSQPGYVLDWLSRQSNQQHSSDPQTSAQARSVLNRFASQGIQALPPEIAAQLPKSERDRYAKPQERAVAMMLAQINAFPQQFEKTAQRLQQTGQAGQAELERLLGRDLAKSLPPSFKALLQDPHTLSQISGLFGKIDLDLGKVRNELEQTAKTRGDAFNQALKSLTDFKNSPLLIQLAENVLVRNGNKYSVDELGMSLAEQDFQQLFKNLGTTLPELRNAYNSQTVQDILKAMADQLSKQPVQQTDNPEYLRQLGNLLVDQLGQRYHSVRDVI